jgi:hypothetical protein
MKNSFKQFAAVVFLSVIAAVPVWAQTNSQTGLTNAVVTSTSPLPAAINIAVPGARINGDTHQSGEGASKILARNLALLIPIVAIVMGCSIPILIVVTGIYAGHRKNKMLHETVRAMIEKGVPIPPEMFAQKEKCASPFGDKPKQPRNDFRSGLMLVGIGAGIVMLAGKPGYIILFLGVASLVASFFEKKNPNDSQPPKP